MTDWWIFDWLRLYCISSRFIGLMNSYEYSHSLILRQLQNSNLKKIFIYIYIKYPYCLWTDKWQQIDRVIDWLVYYFMDCVFDKLLLYFFAIAIAHVSFRICMYVNSALICSLSHELRDLIINIFLIILISKPDTKHICVVIVSFIHTLIRDWLLITV